MLLLACSRAGDRARSPVAADAGGLAVGWEHGCELAGGEVTCWGSEVMIDRALVGLAGAAWPVRGVYGGPWDTCATGADGRLHCWGRHTDGGVVPGIRSPTAVAVALSEALAVLPDGRVASWSLGDETAPEIVAGVAGAVQVTVHHDLRCARRGDGEVLCWTGRDRPRALPGVRGARDVEAADSVWVVRADGTVWRFPTDDRTSAGVQVRGLARVVDVEVADDLACALRVDGRVLCWKTARPEQATVVRGVEEVVDLQVEEKFACVRTRGGEVRCWGANGALQLGEAAGQEHVSAPRRVAGLPRVTDVRVGGRHACAWRPGGALWCWGNPDGFAPATDDWVRPRRVARRVRRALLGGSATCAERSAGRFECRGSRLEFLVPDAKDGLATVVLAGDTTTVDLEDAWGCGAGPGGLQCFGALGHVEPYWRSPDLRMPQVFDVHARELSRPGTIVSLAIGTGHACAVLGDGAALCWGKNRAWQLGYASRERKEREREEAVVVAGLPPVVRVTSEAMHTCALTVGGEAWCWGADEDVVDNYYQPSPAAKLTRVTGAPPLVDVAAGQTHDCGIDGEGTVWCWGENVYGELGRGTRTRREDPGPVPGLADVTRVHIAGGTTCAVDRAGRVWCWGWNGSGKVDPTSPTRSDRALPVASRRRVQVASALARGDHGVAR